MPIHNRVGSVTRLRAPKRHILETNRGKWASLLFAGLLDKYLDLLAAYTSDPTGKSKADWGRTHYCKLGLNENRRILPPGVFVLVVLITFWPHRLKGVHHD